MLCHHTAEEYRQKSSQVLQYVVLRRFAIFLLRNCNTPSQYGCFRREIVALRRKKKGAEAPFFFTAKLAVT
jgi:hypothetical protein